MSALQARSILAVDCNPRNLELLLQALGSTGFEALPVPDLARLDATLAEAAPIGLALVDIDGFEPAIWERCRQLHERKVEVLVLAGRRAPPAVQVQSALCGARAVLPKPLSPKLLAELVRSLMEEHG
jgi:DNA-binding response OmpR family regulator